MNILLVEDHPPDVRLVQLALKKFMAESKLWVVNDGVEAMRFLKRVGDYQNVPLPDLVLLDLNLPKKDGREVLADVRADPELAHIPIAVLSTSESDEDILRSYRLHANCYLLKQGDFHQFPHNMSDLHKFWGSISRLPPKTA